MSTAGSVHRQRDDLAAGTRMGRYRIEDPVGRGGMGVVYQAFDETTNRRVALKLLSKGIPAPLRDRFLAECEAEANIRHEHVMPVYDRGWYTDEQPYFVMELLYQPITLTDLMEAIQGGTLGSTHPRLRHWGDLSRRIADIVLPVCEGVHVANAEYAIQHRDLKPDNVLIDIRTRRAYLIDFGICRSMDDEDDIGKIVGTPRYLSPEQAAGRVDPRTDVWGMGALLRFVVTCEPPLEATSPFTRKDVAERIEVLKAAEAKAIAAGEDAKARGLAGRRAQLEDPALRVQDDIIKDARAGRYLPLPDALSPGLAAIIHKAMAADPEDRYATAGALAADIRTWLKGGSVQALSEAGARGAVVDLARRLLNRNVVRVGGALTALLLGFLLGTGLFSQSPPRQDHRLADAAADLDRLHDEYTAMQALAAASGPGRLLPLACLREHRCAAKALQGLQERTDPTVIGTAASEARAAVVQKARRLEQRMAPRAIEVRGRRLGSWRLEDSFRQGFSRSGSGDEPPSAVPGLYRLLGSPSSGIRIRLAIPGTVPTEPYVIDLTGTPATVPQWMTCVPAGPSIRGGSEIREEAFLASIDLVTNERFSEWLDELTPAERNATVPPTGFRRDARDSTRWLVAQGMGNRPVVGVSPRDAAAYAAWRSEIEGLSLALPTDAQFIRMAGYGRLGEPGAHLILPWLGSTPRRMAHRRGDRSPSFGESLHPRGSPYGVRSVYRRPGELVRSEAGSGWAAKGVGGLLPMRSALERSEPVDLDKQGHAYGFRLVHVSR